MAESILECVIRHRGTDVEKGLHGRPVPAHLLFLVHAFGGDLVDRTLNERRRDRLTPSTSGGIMQQHLLVALPPGPSLRLDQRLPTSCHAQPISTAGRNPVSLPLSLAEHLAKDARTAFIVVFRLSPDGQRIVGYPACRPTEF
jgi:hypothetical protein